MVDEALRAIEELNPRLNAVLRVNEAAPAGIPIAVKDNIVTTDMPTTCASRILGDFVSPFDATAVARLPAALCGVVGLKPTYGRVSRNGLVAFASGLDQIGVVTRTVSECAALLGVIAGHDPLDSTSSAQPIDDYGADVDAGVRALRFGVVREAVEKLEGEVRTNFDAALDVLRGGGAIVQEASVPTIGYAIAVYYIVANAEASANLSRFDGVRYGYRAPA